MIRPVMALAVALVLSSCGLNARLTEATLSQSGKIETPATGGLPIDPSTGKPLDPATNPAAVPAATPPAGTPDATTAGAPGATPAVDPVTGLPIPPSPDAPSGPTEGPEVANPGTPTDPAAPVTPTPPTPANPTAPTTPTTTPTTTPPTTPAPTSPNLDAFCAKATELNNLVEPIEATQIRTYIETAAALLEQMRLTAPAEISADTQVAAAYMASYRDTLARYNWDYNQFTAAAANDPAVAAILSPPSRTGSSIDKVDAYFEDRCPLA